MIPIDHYRIDPQTYARVLIGRYRSDAPTVAAAHEEARRAPWADVRPQTDVLCSP